MLFKVFTVENDGQPRKLALVEIKLAEKNKVVTATKGWRDHVKAKHAPLIKQQQQCQADFDKAMEAYAALANIVSPKNKEGGLDVKDALKKEYEDLCRNALPASRRFSERLAYYDSDSLPKATKADAVLFEQADSLLKRGSIVMKEWVVLYNDHPFTEVTSLRQMTDNLVAFAELDAFSADGDDLDVLIGEGYAEACREVAKRLPQLQTTSNQLIACSEALTQADQLLAKAEQAAIKRSQLSEEIEKAVTPLDLIEIMPTAEFSAQTDADGEARLELPASKQLVAWGVGAPRGKGRALVWVLELPNPLKGDPATVILSNENLLTPDNAPKLLEQ